MNIEDLAATKGAGMGMLEATAAPAAGGWGTGGQVGFRAEPELRSERPP